MKKYPPIFDYHKVMPKGEYSCLISPSSLARLFTNPGEWYRMAVLNQPNPFQGNDATVIGNICHHIYERETNGLPYSRDEIYAQLLELASLRPDLDLVVDEVLNTAMMTADVVLQNYPMKNPGAEVEKEVLVDIGDKIYIGGHIDRVEGSRIVDFKTVSKKPNEGKIPLGHKLQLLAYAAAMGQLGNPIEEICIVYGVKPTKTLAARCYVVKETIGDEHEKLIEYTLNFIKSGLEACKENPNLVPLIFRDFEVSNMY